MKKIYYRFLRFCWKGVSDGQVTERKRIRKWYIPEKRCSEVQKDAVRDKNKEKGFEKACKYGGLKRYGKI